MPSKYIKKIMAKLQNQASKSNEQCCCKNSYFSFNILQKKVTGDSKDDNENEGGETLFCRSLIPRLNQLPKQTKALFRFQVEQPNFQAEMSVQPQNATVCSYIGFNGLTQVLLTLFYSKIPSHLTILSCRVLFHLPLNHHPRLGKNRQHMDTLAESYLSKK